MRLGKIIASVNNKKNAYLNNQLKKTGLSYGQALTINAIHLYGEIQQDMIVKELEIDKSAVTRILKTLEERGFIIKKMCQSDHRIYNITLTKKGEEVYPLIHHILKNMKKTMLKGITDEEKELLVQLLFKIRDNLENDYEQ